MSAASRPEDGSDIRSALKELGQRLRNARREAGLTQRVVADQLEVTTQTIRNWEDGRHEPAHRVKQRLADLYGTTVPEIMGQDATGLVAALTPYSRIDIDPTRLRLARQRASLSLEEASQQSGISSSTLGRYERGSNRPTKTNLATLAALYGRPLTWFVPLAQMRTDAPSLPNMHYDEVLEAYSIAQPDLPPEAVRSIADYIQFLHDRELNGQY